MKPQRIRQYVDDELTPEVRAEVEQTLAGDETLRAQVAFERALRQRVSGHLASCSETAPAELVGALREAIANEVAPQPRSRQSVGTAAEPLETARPSRLMLFMRGPTRANAFAVAACLTIVAGAVLFGIFGEPFLRGGRVPPIETVSALRQTADEAAAEHMLFAQSPQDLARQIRFLDEDAIHRNLDDRLGRRVPMFDLGEVGFTLVGGGECRLSPTPDNSVHLVYENINGPERLSVYLQPDSGQFEEVREDWRQYTAQDLGLEDLPLTPSVWTDGETIYIVVACTAQLHAEAIECIKEHTPLRG